MTSTSAERSISDVRLAQLLKASFQVGASDIHLKADTIPMFRIHGELRPVEFPQLETTELECLCTLLSGKSAEELKAKRQVEFSYHWPGVGRFRGHFYLQQSQPALALRPIPLKIPTMTELRLPPAMKRVCELDHGLVLVSGATGMGKSTTLACLLDAMARSSCRHIITIEDPIEYIVEDGMSCIAQREVGRDVATFHEGLWSALRQDPDVLLIGEVRDRETMEVALQAAQSGHLVLTSAHFCDSTSAVNGIVAMADPKEQVNWRFRLAEVLRAILSQRLLPRRGTPGRVLATELLINEPTVRTCIQDEARSKSIRSCLERGKADHGTHTIDQSLLELLQGRLITVEVAQGAAASPGDLMREVTLRRIAQ
jgi:twitching motility protein PilT